jgi:mannosyltransferase
VPVSTTAAPTLRGRLRMPSVDDRRGTAIVTALLLIGLVAISLLIRTQAISSPFWIDEGLSVGIASHPFSDIFHALREDGSPPLFYLLLHFWMEGFGRSEENTHVLSLLFALLTIPAALWAGWALFGRRTGYVAAALAALNPFLDAYAQETRMYSLLSLLCLLATACFVLAFVRRRRGFLIPLALLLAAIAYTHNWGLFFDAGCVLALVVVWRTAPDRRGIVRDGLLCFGAAALLYAPWVPTLISQAQHTGAPWATRPKPKAWVQVPGNLFGGDLVSFVMLIGAGLGLWALWQRRRRIDGRTLWVVFLVALVAILLAWIASQISPAWSTRYQGVVLGPLLLFAAAGLAYSRWLGVCALAFLLLWWATVPPTPSLQNKSDVDDVVAQLAPQLRPGDHVVSTQPEQIPVLYYYLPGAGGLRYADATGPVGDPQVMDWRDALDRLRASRAATAFVPVLDRMRVGQRILLVSPITENPRSWRAPWTELVRRRSAQYGGLLQGDRRFRCFAHAPAFYRYSSTVGVRGVLCEKVRA